MNFLNYSRVKASSEKNILSRGLVGFNGWVALIPNSFFYIQGVFFDLAASNDNVCSVERNTFTFRGTPLGPVLSHLEAN